jgi:hypothetical protein
MLLSPFLAKAAPCGGPIEMFAKVKRARAFPMHFVCHGRQMTAARNMGRPDYSAGTTAARSYFAAAMSNQL